LPAFVADHHQGHFPRILVHLCRQSQVIRPAFEACNVKLPERTASGRLAGLIIFSAHEISRGIHPHILRPASDIRSPTPISAFSFQDFSFLE
jgi:hypothetical protein